MRRTGAVSAKSKHNEHEQVPASADASLELTDTPSYYRELTRCVPCHKDLGRIPCSS
jgi:hypothetical protein